MDRVFEGQFFGVTLQDGIGYEFPIWLTRGVRIRSPAGCQRTGNAHARTGNPHSGTGNANWATGNPQFEKQAETSVEPV